MAKPTEKQLEAILKRVIAKRIKLLRSYCFTNEEIGRRIQVSDVRAFLEDGIREWEKIKAVK